MSPVKTAKKKAPAKKKEETEPKAKKQKIVETEVVIEVAQKIPDEAEVKAQETPGITMLPERYFEAVGRRKSSIARVRLFTKKSSDSDAPEGKATALVNGKSYDQYFGHYELQNIVESPFKKLKSLNRFKGTILVHGGGIHSQAEAVRHGISRALVLFDENFSKKLKKAGYLTRDSREKERRKYGLKKARKAPRWAKR